MVVAAAAVTASIVVAASFAKVTAPTARRTTLTIGFAQSPYSIFPVFLAQHLGYLKKYGITNVEYRSFSSVPAITAVAQNQIDLRSVLPRRLRLQPSDQRHEGAVPADRGRRRKPDLGRAA